MTAEQRERAAQREQAEAVIASWLGLFIGPGQVTELRALKVRQGQYRPVTVAGFYDHDHLADAAKKALELTRQAAGVYFTLNPLNPALMGRRANRAATAEDGFCASDKDVLSRNWLLIDADPVRPAGVSASDAEKALALETGLSIREFLHERGWPEGIRGDSGNGGHLLYRVQLPADDGGLLKRVLLALAARFDSEAVKIDVSVFNPARICKLYGTLARKGDSIPERPHRRSLILDIPGCADPHDVSAVQLAVVPTGLLAAVAAEAPADSKPAPPPGHSGTNGSGNGEYRNRLKVGEWLTARGVEYTVKDLAGGRTAYVLRHCPFNPDHTGKDVAIFQEADGKLGAKCFHNSCAGNRWQEFKQKIGSPAAEHYDPPFEPRRHAHKGHGGKGAKTRTNGVGPDTLASGTPGVGGGSDAETADKGPPETVEIISDYLRRYYRPVFRRGDVLYSGTLGRPVPLREACAAPANELLNEMIAATDVPELSVTCDGIDRTPLIPHYRKWAPTAYTDLVKMLPDEERSEEVVATAEEEFRGKVATALLHHASLGYRYEGSDGQWVTETQRRTLINWCLLFAKSQWADIRGYQVWCRLDKDQRLRVAIRKELFGQVQGCADLARLSPRKFKQLAENYQVGTAGHVKGGKLRVIELAPDFVAYLLDRPAPADDALHDGERSGSRTCEDDVSKRHASAEPPNGQGVAHDTFHDTSPADAQSVM